MRHMLHISRAVGTLVGRGGNACGVPQVLADKGQQILPTTLLVIRPRVSYLPTALYYGYLLKQIQLGFCWCGLRITTYAQIHQLAHFPRVNFPTNQFRGFRWSVMGNHSWNLIIVGSASQHIEVRGHSTTTWTELCHFMPPPWRGQFLYSEREQKQTFFDPHLPFPSSCPRSYWMAPKLVSKW